MTARLTAIPFTKGDLDAVADFDCGDEPWATYVANWIRGDGVIEALEAGTEVWLYLNAQNEIVGYGSLGNTRWLYPDPYGQQSGSQRVKLSVIPAYAVQKRFQRQPEGGWEQHYSSEIISDLINEAIVHCSLDPELEPLLGLFVDERNIRAMSHYERHGFIKYGKPIKGQGQRMILNLQIEANSQSNSSEQEAEGGLSAQINKQTGDNPQDNPAH